MKALQEPTWTLQTEHNATRSHHGRFCSTERQRSRAAQRRRSQEPFQRQGQQRQQKRQKVIELARRLSSFGFNSYSPTRGAEIYSLAPRYYSCLSEQEHEHRFVSCCNISRQVHAYLELASSARIGCQVTSFRLQPYFITRIAGSLLIHCFF